MVVHPTHVYVDIITLTIYIPVLCEVDALLKLRCSNAPLRMSYIS